MQSILHDKLNLTWLLASSAGPITRAKGIRTKGIYALTLILALAVGSLDRSHAGDVLSFGLMIPGGGYLAVGQTAMFLLSFGAFISSLILWFGTGNVILPPLIWIGAALSATIHEPSSLLLWDPEGVAVVLLCFTGALVLRDHIIPRQDTTNTTAPRLAAAAKQQEMENLSREDLAKLRLIWDRALQPVENFDGFDWIDQFQTSAVRYQLNFASYALSFAQARAFPAFKGYQHESQQNLLLKQQDPRIWNYWKYESLWGHLSRNTNPMIRDNVMYSGFIGLQMSLWEKVRSYDEASPPPSLALNVPGKGEERYDLQRISNLLASQYRSAEFGLLASEPNWIYPLCNAISVAGVRGNDAIRHQNLWGSFSGRFERDLKAEFQDLRGRLVPFRSSITGLAPVGLGGPVMQAFPCLFLNASMPEVSQHLWAQLQKTDWTRNIWPVDVGNYGLSRAAGLSACAAAACEMGDRATSERLLAALDATSPAVLDQGVIHRPNASIWAHAVELMAHFGSHDGFRSIIETPKFNQHKAYLKSAPYPDVLVSKAVAREEGIDCSVYKSEDTPPTTLVFAGLVPYKTYRNTSTSRSFQADKKGELAVRLCLDSPAHFNLKQVV